MSSLLVSLALVATLAGSGGGAGATWARYAPGSVSVVADSEEQLVCEGSRPARPIWTIAGDDHARTAIATYTGRSRPLTGTHRELLARWRTSLGLPSSAENVFEREYLFHEGDRAYWLPVQAPVAGYFSAELRPSAPVLLYVIWGGAHCAGSGATWLFLVNEFQALTEQAEDDAAVARDGLDATIEGRLQDIMDAQFPRSMRPGK